MGLLLMILFVVTMFLWLLMMLGAVAASLSVMWLAWFALLFLGLAVFVGGVTWPK